MNKRSFFCGVFVGVLVTWALSFYLYYSLNSDQSTTKTLASIQKNIFNLDFEDEQDSSEEDSHHNALGLENDYIQDGKSSYNKGKKKVKEKKKKFRPDLEPVPIEQSAEFGLIRNIEDQFIRDNGYKTHAFNVLVSNQIGTIRVVPDTRHPS